MKQPPKTLADLRAKYDVNVIVPTRIKARFAAMLKIGPEEHDYEADFLKAAGIANAQISPFREQFKKHIATTKGQNPKRIWFADPKVAAKFREAIGDTDEAA